MFERILQEAAEVIIKTAGMNQQNDSWHKEDNDSARSIVTSTDYSIEKALIDHFSTVLPDYSILSEEKGFLNRGYDKVIVIDPLDCTKGYKEGKDNYGSFIAIYQQGKCVAGMDLHIPTKTSFIGSEERFYSNASMEKTGAFYVEFASDESLNREIERRMAGLVMPIESNAHVLNKVRAFTGYYEGLVHTRWSYHDLGAAPLFGRLTGRKVTDAQGREFEPIDFQRISELYSQTNNEIYSIPVVIAKPELHGRIIDMIKDLF